MKSSEPGWLATIAAAAVLCAAPAVPVQGQAVAPLPTIPQSHPAAPKPPQRPLQVTPQLPPLPALKHRFVPSHRRQQAGRADRSYLRAVILLQAPHLQEKWREYSKVDSETGWVDGPLDRQRLAAAKKWLSGMPIHPVVEELRRATELRDNSLRLDLPRDMPLEEMFAVLLPEIQELRSVARLLSVDIRVAIAEGRHDDAIERLRMGYWLAAAFGESDFLVSRLVGVAIASMMTELAEELTASPDAPNLYWALATLPRPVVPVASSARIELENIKMFMADELKDTGGLSAEQWTTKTVDIVERLQTLGGGGSDLNRVQLSLAVAGGLTMAYPAAKTGLVERGHDAKQVEAMSAAEVVLRWTDLEVRRMADDMQKWTLLPSSLRRQHVAASQDAFDRLVSGGPQKGIGPGLVAGLLMPAVSATLEAEARLQMRVDLLLTAEAIRAHAAAHDGRLPASLDELSPLPALPNPRTGEPFGYKVEGRGAAAVAELSAKDAVRPHYNRVLRLQLRQAK